jgi:hypothetical protein
MYLLRLLTRRSGSRFLRVQVQGQTRNPKRTSSWEGGAVANQAGRVNNKDNNL